MRLALRTQVVRALFLVVACVPNLVTVAYAGETEALSWSVVKKSVRWRFAGVPQMSVAQLQRELASASPPLLLDAREAPEFAVSHLRHAVLATDLSTAQNLLVHGPKDRHLVIYCSVGWRSSALAAQLMRLGYTQVSNLEGSIFEWANAGLPVYRADVVVTEVHPYNRQWGTLLRNELRASLPGDSKAAP